MLALLDAFDNQQISISHPFLTILSIKDHKASTKLLSTSEQINQFSTKQTSNFLFDRLPAVSIALLTRVFVLIHAYDRWLYFAHMTWDSSVLSTRVDIF